MSKLIRLSQAPPVPGGLPSPIPGMPPGGGAASGTPMPTMPMSAPAPPGRAEISGPLDSLAKILYDANITDVVSNNTSDDPEKIAMDIWTEYGGDEVGNARKGCEGTRTDEDGDMPADPETLKKTDKMRWLRLPEGKTIADITSLEEMSKIMNGLVMGVAKDMAKQNGGGGGPGGPGGPPGGPAAFNAKSWLRMASISDQLRMYEFADQIDVILSSI